MTTFPTPGRNGSDPSGDSSARHVDLGGLQIPVRNEVTVHAHAVSDGDVDVVCTHVDGAVQLQPYTAAAEGTSWPWIMAEILARLAEVDATATTAAGPFGAEVHATVPAALAAGQPLRPLPILHLGLDGPGWFLYATLTGPAAREPLRATPLEALLADTTVDPGPPPSVDAPTSAPVASEATAALPEVRPIALHPRRAEAGVWPPAGLLQLWLPTRARLFPGAPQRLYLHDHDDD